MVESMKLTNSKTIFQEEIERGLCSLITSEYLLLEVPNHMNVGDYLIWQGELDYLATLPYRRIGMSTSLNFTCHDIDNDVVILFNGGGSFGDVWPDSLEFKLKVVEYYKRNRIVFFPQSVQFNDVDIERRALSILQSHPNLIVCARDAYSYGYLKKSGISTRLIPDMAFYMNMDRFSASPELFSDLFVVRNDREQNPANEIEAAVLMSGDRIVSDWPTIDGHMLWTRAFCLFSLTVGRFGVLRWVTEFVLNRFIRNLVCRVGCKFVDSAKVVHTTRLHAGILALMRGKRVVLYDNSYGKLARFYDTWLRSSNEVTMKGVN